MMKTILSTLLTCSSLLSLRAVAQEEAVPTFSTNGAETSLVIIANGAGFEFNPNVEIAITALGFGGTDLENNSYQVSLYNAVVRGNVNSPAATALITTGSTFYNQTYYESITPVDLFPGKSYYIEAGAVGTSYWNGFPIGGAPIYGSFAVNPDITYDGAKGDFINGVPENSYPSSIFFDDINFQFVVVPEPSVLCLATAGVMGMIWHRWRR
jgi:hypothetical protein